MTLHDLTHAQVHELRDQAEAELSTAVDKGVRRFLRMTQDEALADLRTSSLLAAGNPNDPLTLGQMNGWWGAIVDADIVTAIRRVWITVYRRTRDGVVTKTSLEGLDEYMSRVKDRLVRGLQPPLPADAFNRIRVAVTQSAAEGWSRTQLSDRIGAELSWTSAEPYWRAEKTRIDARIDAILDPLGAPGTPAREAARLSDPLVQALRNDRNTATKAIEQEQSHWKTRADLIARTEATGANNYGALSALIDEGVTHKTWLSTKDTRTRLAHRPPTDHQTVPILEPFDVDGTPIMMPGDPSAPIALTANCRCTLVSASGEEIAALGA